MNKPAEWAKNSYQRSHFDGVIYFFYCFSIVWLIWLALHLSCLSIRVWLEWFLIHLNSLADPKQRMTLESVAAHRWVVRDCGPIHLTSCRCKLNCFQKEAPTWGKTDCTWSLLIDNIYSFYFIHKIVVFVMFYRFISCKQVNFTLPQLGSKVRPGHWTFSLRKLLDGHDWI